MKEKIIVAIGASLDELNLWIDNAQISKREAYKYLEISLDSQEIIDAKKVEEAAKIIDPIIDKLDLISDSYILDIYAKPKGDDKNE